MTLFRMTTILSIMRSLRLVSIVIFLGISVVASAESYIVPIWATAGLEGSDGEWWTQATVVNPNDFPVSYRITRVFPMHTAECADCAGQSIPVTLESHASRTIYPPSGMNGRRLLAGAFEVDSSAPVLIHLVALRPGPMEIRQRLDVARRWLSAGVRSISTVERGGTTWRMNVFVVNPTDNTLRLSLWTNNRADEIHASVPPNQTAVIRLAAPKCGGVACPFPTGFPPEPIAVHVEADGLFLVSVSSLESDWAVFSIADESVN